MFVTLLQDSFAKCRFVGAYRQLLHPVLTFGAHFLLRWDLESRLGSGRSCIVLFGDVNTHSLLLPCGCGRVDSEG